MPGHILVVDDDPNVLEFFVAALADHDLRVTGAVSGEEALNRIDAVAPDLVFLDLRLPGMDGLETHRILRERRPELPVVIITSHADVESAVRTMDEGALDYLPKPVRSARLLEIVGRLLPPRHAPTGPGRQAEDASIEGRPPLLGRAPAMVEVFKAIAQVAQTDATVLITGETGSGKELIARAIHHYSRPGSPFVAVNCAAMPDTLIESELFGHAKGAFTGADRPRPGAFAGAGTGTLLLDEIGDMAVSLQPKLLRVLEERTVHPLGGDPVALRARVIAATHRDLTADIAAGRFRDDLYFRLSEVEIRAPALRERLEDLPLLVPALLAQLARERVGPALHVDPEVYARLAEHPWPGNVRELRNALARALLRSRGGVITPADLPALAVMPADRNSGDEPSPASLDELEARHIRIVLEDTGWNRSEAARRLGIHRNTLRRKIRHLGIAPGKPSPGT